MFSIVIPTLQKCKENLYMLVDNLAQDTSVGEIIIVDNSLKGFDYNNEKVRVIIPKENIFVNPAWNLGVKEAKYDLIGLLNDDIAIAKDFCKMLEPKITDKIGIVGFDVSGLVLKDVIDSNPALTEFQLKPTNFRGESFGIAMFFHKSSYTEIPNEMRINYGDDWLIKQCKRKKLQNYTIVNQTVYHLGSISTLSGNLNPIFKEDGKIYKKLTVKWYHRLLSFDETLDEYKLRLFGITLRFKKKNVKLDINEHNYYNRKKQEDILSKKRVAVFAHYDKDNIIQDYVVYYIKELKKVADKIIFVSDSDVKENELAKIQDYVENSIVGRHGEYDFGSYKRGYIYAKEQGLLSDADELIFANDSCYGPLYPFQNMFGEMSQKDVDFWGITINKNGCIVENNKIIAKELGHVQSYFIVLRSNVFNSNIFEDYIYSIKKTETKTELVALYEVGLSQILINNGFKFDVYCKLSKETNNPHLTIWKKLISEDKSPLLKRSIPLYRNAKHQYPINLKAFLNKCTDYDFNLIKKDRKTNAEKLSLFKKVYYYFRNLRKEVISVRLKTGEIILFGRTYHLYKRDYVYNYVQYSFAGIKCKIKRKDFENIDTLNIIFPKWMGLGNRILGLVNSIKLYNPKVVNVFWENKTWVSASMRELFELNFEDGPEINEYNDIENCIDWNSSETIITINSPIPELKTSVNKDISQKYNNISPEDIDEFLGYFIRIKPSEKVKHILSKGILPENYVAVHIRNNNDWKEYGRNTDLSEFDDIIKSYPKNTRFYLSAMNKDIEDRFIKKYKDQIIVMPNKNYSSMIDAVVDLFILSQTKEAIYSYGSTFSELAFWLGGAKQKVKIVGNKKNWR